MLKREHRRTAGGRSKRKRTAQGGNSPPRRGVCPTPTNNELESQNWQRLIVENVRDFAIFSADVNGRINSWNPGAERFFGYNEAEILGQPMEILYVPEDRAAGVAKREQAAAAETGFSEDERWHLRKDGSRFFVFGMVNAMYDDRGELCGYTKIARDITDRREMQEKLQRTREDLEEVVAQRTARLTEAVHELEAFSYSLSHDMRAPLRAMQGFSEILRTRYATNLPEEGKDLLGRIARSAYRLDGLIRDALTYHRIAREPLQLHTVDLDALVDAILSEQPGIVGEGDTLTVEHPLLKVRGHEPLLTQCLFNLLGNAIRFGVPERKARVRVWTEAIDGHVTIWVEDNGIGIPEQDQEKIWNMFIRLHPEKYEGTGIGLAIVRKAVERMGGKVGVKSQAGNGSKFWIQLPAPAGDLAAPTPLPSKTSHA